MAIGFFYCRARMPEYFGADLSFGASLRPTCPLAPSYAAASEPAGWSVEIIAERAFPHIGPIRPSSRPVQTRLQYSAIVHNESAPPPYLNL